MRDVLPPVTLQPAMTVLVAAASKHDATQEIAEAIGRVLAERGLDVQVKPVEAVEDVQRYDAVVLGSAVYVGKWMAEARRFVEQHADELAARPTWLFSSGPIGDPPRPEAGTAVDVDAIVAATHAREHRLFAGKLDKSRLAFAERAVARAVRAPEGDFRAWEEIEAWAADIAEAVRK
jgi:menaquinone-dependent protoporphyrinogen oxidase